MIMEETTAEWVTDEIQSIRDLARNAPGRPGTHLMQADITEIQSRAQTLLNMLCAPKHVNGDLRAELDKLRESIESHGSVEDAVTEILSWCDEWVGGPETRHELRERLGGAGSPEAVADQLANLPGLRPPYRGIGDAAERIVDFIASQPDGRATGIEHWVLVKLQERAAIRRREEIAGVMRRVAVDHLYPALRDIGVEDPESMWELRGKWES